MFPRDILEELEGKEDVSGTEDSQLAYKQASLQKSKSNSRKLNSQTQSSGVNKEQTNSLVTSEESELGKNNSVDHR